MLRTPVMLSAVAIAALALVACASDRGPAEQAIKAAEDAFNVVKTEAVQYVPEQAKAVETQIASAKASLEKGDYKAVLTAAPDITGKATALRAAVAAKKAELEAKKKELEAKVAVLTKEWEDMSAGLPKMVAALESRVSILDQAKKLPAKLEKTTVEAAKAGLAEVKRAWSDAQEAFKGGKDAQEAFKGGKVDEAVAKAKIVKDKTAEIMTKLGMQVPQAAAKS
jgi:hypothetical protein